MKTLGQLLVGALLLSLSAGAALASPPVSRNVFKSVVRAQIRQQAKAYLAANHIKLEKASVRVKFGKNGVSASIMSMDTSWPTLQKTRMPQFTGTFKVGGGEVDAPQAKLQGGWKEVVHLE